MFAPLYRALIVQKYLQKDDPNFTGSQFIISKNISQQPQEVNSQVLYHCTDR